VTLLEPPRTTHRAIEAVWRIEAARLIAGLGRLVHDIGQAEELAQDALVAALEQWPEGGVPENPGAWLMAVAKRRAIDQIRRRERFERKQVEIGHDLETRRDPSEDDFDAVLDAAAGNISDALEERYAFSLAGIAPGEHTVAVRAYDHFDNVGSAKTTINISGTKP